MSLKKQQFDEGTGTRLYKLKCREDFSAVVIDCGADTVKVGFGGDDRPKAVFPNLVKHSGNRVDSCAFVGEECAEHAKCGRIIVSTTTRPIDRGIVTDWESMEQIWRYAFVKMQVDPAEHPVLLVEHALTPRASRERMIKFMFEIIDVPALYVQQQPVLAVYAAGLTSAYVLDVGDTIGTAQPVYEGYCLPHALVTLHVAGRDLTNYLRDLLEESGRSLRSESDAQSMLRTIKETLCFVALDFKKELKEGTKGEALFEMPNGGVIALNDQRFRCPEALFQPDLIRKGKGAIGVVECLSRSVRKCDLDLQSEIKGKTVLCGGCTLFPGFSERLSKEFETMTDEQQAGMSPFKPEMIANQDRKFASWVGGSITASLNVYGSSMWIQKEEYEELGEKVIHSKCY